MITNSKWQVHKEKVIARGQGNLALVYIERALNSELWNIQGNRYINFGAGIAVANTGHKNPNVTKAVIQITLRKLVTPVSWLILKA